MLILDAGGRAAMQRRRQAGGNKTLQWPQKKKEQHNISFSFVPLQTLS